MDICDDISLGFAVQKYQPYLLCVFVHNPCGTVVSSKIRKCVSSMENILGLQLKEACKDLLSPWKKENSSSLKHVSADSEVIHSVYEPGCSSPLQKPHEKPSECLQSETAVSEQA